MRLLNAAQLSKTCSTPIRAIFRPFSAPGDIDGDGDGDLSDPAITPAGLGLVCT